MQYNYDSGDPKLHRQVKISVKNDDADASLRLEVDEGIAALIEALWQKGYRTVASCQNAEAGDGLPSNRAWVSFENMKQASRFARLVARHDADILWVNNDELRHAPADDPVHHGAVAVTFDADAIDDVTRIFS